MHARRSAAREVLDDHLRLADASDLETDLERNFAEDVVLLTGYGVFRGIEGVREKARLLSEQLLEARWTYRTLTLSGVVGSENRVRQWTEAPCPRLEVPGRCGTSEGGR